MSRNDLFLLIACAVAVTIMSGDPLPLTRSAPVTLASLGALNTSATTTADLAMLQHSFDRQ